MDALGYGLRDPQCPVDPPAGTMVVKDDNAGLVQEEATDKVSAHAQSSASSSTE